MTVSTEVSREEYTGNGVTTDFDYRFRVFEAEDLVVSVADTTETITVLSLNTDYTVTGAGSRTGGKVKLFSPLAFNWRISIERALPVTQETDVRNQGNFFPEVHEDAWDKLTMLIQQVWSYFGLALRKPTWLSKYYDAQGNRIANLGNPINPQDAATKSYVDAGDAANSQHVEDLFKRTFRVPENSVGQLPGIAMRRNKLVACNDNGDPISVLPESGSAADVMIELAKSTGMGLVGYFSSVSELRASTGLKTGGIYNLAGYYGTSGSNGLGPSGGGLFIAVDGAGSIDDGGLIFINASGQALKRVFSGRNLDSAWFGAKGDGVTPDQDAINLALAAADRLVSTSTGNNRHIGAADVILHGEHFTTGPIIFPNNAGGVGLIGEGGASISTAHATGAYEGGYSAVIIFGRQQFWAANFGACVWRNRIHNIKIQRKSGVSCYAIIASGVRDMAIRDVQIDGHFIGVWLENCSESVLDRVFTIGCGYGFVLNGRYSHNSPLKFSFGTNDVSNNNFTNCSHRNPIIAGMLQICTRQNRFYGAYVGLWGSGSTPALPPNLNLPADVCAIHIANNIKGDTYGSLYDGFIFESLKDRNTDAIKVTIPGKGFPTHGLQFNSCYLQVYASDYANDKVTTLFNFDIAADAQYESIASENCGVRYQDAGYFYPRFVRNTGVKRVGRGLTIRNTMCPWMLTTSNAGGAYIESVYAIERVNMEDAGFLTSNWSVSNAAYVTAKAGTGANGLAKAYRFTGTTDAIYIEKTFGGNDIRGNNYRNGAILVQFNHIGDTKPYVNFLVNGLADTNSDLITADNIGRYGNVLVDYLDLSGTRTVLFRPFSAGGIAFNSLRVRIGRAAVSDANGYTDISNVTVGFIETGTMLYQPTAN